MGVFIGRQPVKVLVSGAGMVQLIEIHAVFAGGVRGHLVRFIAKQRRLRRSLSCSLPTRYGDIVPRLVEAGDLVEPYGPLLHLDRQRLGLPAFPADIHPAEHISVFLGILQGGAIVSGHAHRSRIQAPKYPYTG